MVMFLITKEFTFDSAHFLPAYRGKCEKMHGHTYRLAVAVKSGEMRDGIVFDFTVLKKIVEEKIVSRWDHELLNDHLEVPSAENMCRFVWDTLFREKKIGRLLYEVKIWETPTSSAAYRGPDGSFGSCPQ